MPLTTEAPGSNPQRAADITVGLINNMPDAAIEATERQFSELLRAAAAATSVRLVLSYLPEVPRGASAGARLAADYWPLERLLESRPDALIVTGMEPGTGPLTEAPYWGRFAQLVDWARTYTISSIWSCLAAHAAALRLDGIQRQRLEHKCFGVFEHEVLLGHPLMSGLHSPLVTPHSRWNELPVAALRAAGYTILAGSTETGADTFAKEVGSSFVFFQGHPEYEDTTLLKEYRRDVGRFARREQAHYPGLPSGYFSESAEQLLKELRSQLLSHAGSEAYASFPAESVAASLRSCWRTGAVRIYGNWLSLIAATKKKATLTARKRAIT
jgi:homoserine O-succinyltransferase